MRLERVTGNLDAGFYRGDPVIDDHPNWHLAQPHPDHFAEAHRRIRYSCSEPEPEKIEKNNREHKREERQYREPDEIKRFHIARNPIGRGVTRKVLINGAPKRAWQEIMLGGGLEPPCLSAYAPQTYVSAIPPPERREEANFPQTGTGGKCRVPFFSAGS